MPSLARLAAGVVLLLPLSTLGGPIYGSIVGGPNPKRIDVGCPDFEPQAYRRATLALGNPQEAVAATLRPLD